MKKVTSLMLALVLCLALCIPVFAEEPAETDREVLSEAYMDDDAIDLQSPVSVEHQERGVTRVRRVITYEYGGDTFYITLYGYFYTMEKNSVQFFDPNTCSVSVHMIGKIDGKIPSWELAAEASKVSASNPQEYRFAQQGYICFDGNRLLADLKASFYCSDTGVIS